VTLIRDGQAFGLPDAKGALVNDVLKDSPAAKAGLKRGDVIRSFDGKRSNPRINCEFS